MKKFVRFFVCIIFSISLFSQNVYAASSSYNVVLLVDRASTTWSPTTFVVPPFVSSAPSTVVGTSTARSVSYDWVDHLTLRWKDQDSNVAVPNGFYNYSCRLVYTFKVKWSGGFPYGVLPASLSPSFTISNLPSGSTFQLISYRDVSDSDSDSLTYAITFDLRGNSYFSNSRSSTFDINFHVGFVNSISSSTASGSNTGLYNITVTPSVVPQGYSSIIFLTSESESSDALLQDITGAVNDVNETIKKEHQEEIDKADQTSKDITSSSGKLEGTLSAWEIFTMPFQLVKDFAQAISSDGDTGFTFPSFSMMGYEIWPSYTFDLSTIKTNFPVLYNGLHLVSGTIVVSGFIHYCWRKWSILMGDDMPESSSGSEGG